MPPITLKSQIGCGNTGPFKLKPWSAIVRDKDHGWSPLLWVVYLGFFFIDPVVNHASRGLWTYDILGAAVFLLLYFGLFVLEYPRAYMHVGGMVLLGVLFLPINMGACTFFIFAAAMLPFCVGTQLTAWIGLVVIGGIGALEGLVRHIHGWTMFYSALFPVIIGAGNTFLAERNRMNRQLRKANEELEHLAKLAERERIARDLHDVLGHTLSVIVLKSELAGRLFERDPQRARQEIGDVEQVSRKALSEVREAIRGYRSEGLVAEIERAHRTLDAAGVTLTCESKLPSLSAAEETVLSLAVRESVTNIVRHAQASQCWMRFVNENGHTSLTVEDNGR